MIEVTDKLIQVTSECGKTLLMISMDSHGKVNVISKTKVFKEDFVNGLTLLLMNGMIT